MTTASEGTFLIVGAGQAGAMAAAALRGFGHAGRIVLVGEESVAPYERPPLSKAVLSEGVAGKGDAGQRIGIHPEGFHAEKDIELRTGLQVLSLDAASSIAALSDGSTLAFERCLLATGGRPRTLPSLPEGTPNVHYIRTLADAHALRTALQRGGPVLVLGAGFLGLEIASTARALGLAVTVLESAARVLPRAVPPELSHWLQQRASEAGVDLRLGCRTTAIEPQADGVAVTLQDGSVLKAPTLVVAIGQVPEVALARAAGLELHPANGGVRVDAQCRSSAPNIFAAGDCASRVLTPGGEELRLESWQSANEQARLAAAAMLGVATEPAAAPWFWTDQFGCNLQMLGLPAEGLHYRARGELDAACANPKFLLFGSDGAGRLRHVLAVNAGGDLRPLRPLFERREPCDAGRLCDASVPLRQLVRDALAAAPAPSPASASTSTSAISPV